MGTKTSDFGVSGRESHDSKAYYSRGLFDVSLDKKAKPLTPNPDSVDKLYCKSSAVMDELFDNSVAFMFTSPPYHVGKEYDTDDSIEDFLSGVIIPVFEECYRVIEPGGRAAVNVAGLGRAPYFPFPHLIDEVMRGIGFLPRGEIIWQKAKGASGSCAWGSWLSASNPSLRDIHEKILVYSKGRFDRHPERVGKKRPDSDKEAFMRDTLSIWEVRPESARRVGHPAPFPVELARRLIELYTFENDLVLDPFIGSGTTAVAAAQLDRKYVGYDIVSDYVKAARERVRVEGRRVE